MSGSRLDSHATLTADKPPAEPQDRPIDHRQTLILAVERYHRPLVGYAKTLLDQTHARPDPGPDASAELLDDQRALLSLVASLPGQQREVVQLRFQGGLSYKQIGEVTGQSVSYVGVLLHQAIATLREQMNQITA